MLFCGWVGFWPIVVRFWSPLNHTDAHVTRGMEVGNPGRGEWLGAPCIIQDPNSYPLFHTIILLLMFFVHMLIASWLQYGCHSSKPHTVIQLCSKVKRSFCFRVFFIKEETLSLSQPADFPLVSFGQSLPWVLWIWPVSINQSNSFYGSGRTSKTFSHTTVQEWE